jgi:hypothetical protein
MLAASDREQISKHCILDREEISKQWDFGSWPLRLLGRLVNEQKWRKNFQNMIYTKVCGAPAHAAYARILHRHTLDSWI